MFVDLRGKKNPKNNLVILFWNFFTIFATLFYIFFGNIYKHERP